MFMLGRYLKYLLLIIFYKPFSVLGMKVLWTDYQDYSKNISFKALNYLCFVQLAKSFKNNFYQFFSKTLQNTTLLEDKRSWKNINKYLNKNKQNEIFGQSILLHEI